MLYWPLNDVKEAIIRIVGKQEVGYTRDECLSDRLKEEKKRQDI